MSNNQTLPITLIIIGLLLVFGIAIYFRKRAKEKCPKCGKHWAAESKGIETTEEYKIWDNKKKRFGNSPVNFQKNYGSDDYIE